MGMEWIKEISGSSYVTLGLILLALLSFILMIIFYHRSKRIKRPFYSIKHMNIIRDFRSRIDSLEISIGGESVENLTVTQVAFWNGGKETIRKNDITSAEPLEISVKEPFKILEAKILVVNNPANEISIRRIKSESGKHFIQLNFEYLDMDEGCVVQIIHDGYSSKDILVSGTIIGAGKPKNRELPSGRDVNMLFPFPVPIKFKNVRHQGVLYFILGFIIVLIGTGIFLLSNTDDNSGYIVCWILGALLILLSSVLIKRRIPKGLETFEDIQ